MADPVKLAMPAPAGPAPGVSELGSREDATLEAGLQDLARAAAVLAINLKTHLRSPDNPVFRASLANQHVATLTSVEALLAHPNVPWDDVATRAVSDTVDAMAEPCAKVTWLGHAACVTRIFQLRADAAYAPERLAREGPPSDAHAALLKRHAHVPEPTAQPAPGPAAAAPTASAREVPPDPPSRPRDVLFEKTFTYGDPAHPHHAHVGEMYLGFARHARGLDEKAARLSLTPAAVVGFASSLERALADYHGVVAFRIVRADGKVGMELGRLSAPPPAGPRA